MAVLYALKQVLPFFLVEGNILSLGDFGTFRINLHGIGAASKDEMTASNITSFMLNFRPGKELSELLKHIEAIKA